MLVSSSTKASSTTTGTTRSRRVSILGLTNKPGTPKKVGIPGRRLSTINAVKPNQNTIPAKPVVSKTSTRRNSIAPISKAPHVPVEPLTTWSQTFSDLTSRLINAVKQVPAPKQIVAASKAQSVEPSNKSNALTMFEDNDDDDILKELEAIDADTSLVFREARETLRHVDKRRRQTLAVGCGVPLYHDEDNAEEDGLDNILDGLPETPSSAKRRRRGSIQALEETDLEFPVHRPTEVKKQPRRQVLVSKPRRPSMAMSQRPLFDRVDTKS